MKRRRGTPRIPPRLIGAVTALIALVLLVITFAQPTMPWSQPLRIRLAAGDFGQLNPGAHVDLGGIHIGSVDSTEYRDGHVVLDMSIKPQYASLIHADAAAQVRPYGLLGPKHVEIDGGATGQIANGATIPLSRSSVSTDLQDVLNTLQPDVRDNLQVIFIELGTASDNRGADMHSALQDLGEAATDYTTVTATLRARDANVASFIDSSERFNRDIQNAPISAQIADTNQVLNALVQVEGALGDGIDQTAGVMIELHTALEGNQRNLAYVLAKSPGTLQKLEKVMKTEGILVRDISPSLPSLMTAVVETQSAFSEHDATGHWVRVQALSGACTVPNPAPFTGTPAQPDCAGKPSTSGQTAKQTSSGTVPQSSSASITDQQMINFMLGS